MGDEHTKLKGEKRAEPWARGVLLSNQIEGPVPGPDTGPNSGRGCRGSDDAPDEPRGSDNALDMLHRRMRCRAMQACRRTAGSAVQPDTFS